MGFFLGKFVYLMDAIEDVGKDRKKRNYNLFADCEDIWGGESEEQIRMALTGMMTEAARAFERLPVLEHAEIIRNILYSGVWCKYAGLKQLDEKKRSESELRSGKSENVRTGAKHEKSV